MGSIYGEDGNKNGSEVKADTLQCLQLSAHVDFKLLVIVYNLEVCHPVCVGSITK